MGCFHQFWKTVIHYLLSNIHLPPAILCIFSEPRLGRCEGLLTLLSISLNLSFYMFHLFVCLGELPSSNLSSNLLVISSTVSQFLFNSPIKFETCFFSQTCFVNYDSSSSFIHFPIISTLHLVSAWRDKVFYFSLSLTLPVEKLQIIFTTFPVADLKFSTHKELSKH